MIVSFMEAGLDKIKAFEHSFPILPIFQSSKWLLFLSEYLEAENHSFALLDDEEKVLGYFPILAKQTNQGLILNSLPFYGSHGGAVTNSPEVARALISYYNQLVQDLDVITSTYISSPFLNFNELENTEIQFDERDVRIGQITFYEDFAKKDPIEAFHYKTRNMVRKGFKQNLKICIDNSMMEALFEVHVDNMTAISGRPKERRFFEAAFSFFEPGKDYNLYVGKIDGEVAALILLFYSNHVVEYFTPAIVSKYRSTQALSAVIYQAMLDSIGNGFKCWNWGGTWKSQEGVHRFKKRWAATDMDYSYYVTIKKPLLNQNNLEDFIRQAPGFYLIPFSQLDGDKVS